ncbi:MAG: type III secretion system inner membrane ring lipoprotein SctJ [Gammaproteobacteria bacterium]
MIRHALVLVGLALLLTGCGKVDLYNGLSETQANEVAASLLAQNISADKRRADDKKRWVVSVAKADMANAMRVLTAAGLPRQEYQSLGDVFAKKGFVSSPLEEKARYVHGLSQELAQTLAAIDGVRHARVHIAMPERDALTAEAKPSSASVVIVVQRDSGIESRETDIKAIVKDGVEGLDDVNKVTVKFFNAPVVEPLAQREQLSIASLPYPESQIGLVVAVAGLAVWWLLHWRFTQGHRRLAATTRDRNKVNDRAPVRRRRR